LPQGQGKPPVFKATVDRVTVAATVRDQHGRPVTTLKAQDFTLLDSGEKRQILEFERDQAPMNLAILADYSGSMDIAAKRQVAREMVKQLVGGLMPGQDQVGLFAFDLELREIQPMRPAPADVVQRIERLEPWGKTRLLDSIAETGRKLAQASGGRRAVVVLTDGDDNASDLSAPQVSASRAASTCRSTSSWCLAARSRRQVHDLHRPALDRRSAMARGQPGPLDGRRHPGASFGIRHAGGDEADRRRTAAAIFARVRAGQPAGLASARSPDATKSHRARAERLCRSRRRGATRRVEVISITIDIRRNDNASIHDSPSPRWPWWPEAQRLARPRST
jgi:hypothetical protein